MKRAALLLAPAVLLLVAPSAARAQVGPVDGVLSVSFYPRAAGNDLVVACSDHDFKDRTEALDFAHVIGPKLGFGPGSVVYDTTDYTNCVSLFPDGGLTRPGSHPHERVFRFDPAPVAAAANERFHLDLIGIDVCAPELPVNVTPYQGLDRIDGDCDHPFQSSYSWFSNDDGSPPGTITLSYRATPKTLLFGLLGDAGFWLVTVAILAFLARRLGRKEWRVFVKHRIIAWIPTVVLLLLLMFGAAFVAPYATGWIPSLQLYLHIGSGWERFLVAIPTFGLGFVMIGGPIRAGRKMRPAPSQPPVASLVGGKGTIPRLQIEDRWSRRAIVLGIVGLIPVVIFFVLIESWATGRWIRVAALVLSAALLFGDGAWIALQRWVGRARNAPSGLLLLRAELASLGLEVTSMSTTSRPVLVELRFRGGVSPVAVARKTALVWEGVAGYPPAVLAGAAVDSLGLPQLLFLTVLVIPTAALVVGPGRSWVIGGIAAALGAVFLIRIVAAIRRRRRFLRAAQRSHRSAEYLKGIVLSRWIAARMIAPTTQAAFLGRLHPAAQIWRRSLRDIRKFAARAGISPDDAQTIIQEVVAARL